MTEDTIIKSVRYTGMWTTGTVEGLLIAGPPLLLLVASLGLMIRLIGPLIPKGD